MLVIKQIIHNVIFLIYINYIDKILIVLRLVIYNYQIHYEYIPTIHHYYILI